MTLAAFLFLSLSGCASMGNQSKAKEDAQIDVYLIADKDINQDVLGIPSPVRLSFLQLASEIEFRQMMQMNTEDMPYVEFLGESVLDETNVTIRPNQILDFKLPLNDKANYLGVVAAYRDDESTWKNALTKQEKRWYQLKDANFLYLHITANSVIQLQKQAALEKMLAMRLQEQGEDVAKLAEDQKKKLLKQMKQQMKSGQRADLSKGYFAEQNSTPATLSIPKKDAPLENVAPTTKTPSPIDILSPTN